jgi:hypothetical protein
MQAAFKRHESEAEAQILSRNGHYSVATQPEKKQKVALLEVKKLVVALAPCPS